MDRDFELKGKKFKLNKIHAMKQFHIVRRIAPLLAELLPALEQAAKSKKSAENMSEDEKLSMVANFVAPIMEGLSKLSDADSEKVLFGLLSSVETQQITGNWAKISNDTMLVIDDFELPVLMQIASKAFMFNLSGFFAALPSVSPSDR